MLQYDYYDVRGRVRCQRICSLSCKFKPIIAQGVDNVQGNIVFEGLLFCALHICFSVLIEF